MLLNLPPLDRIASPQQIPIGVSESESAKIGVCVDLQLSRLNALRHQEFMKSFQIIRIKIDHAVYNPIICILKLQPARVPGLTQKYSRDPDCIER